MAIIDIAVLWPGMTITPDPVYVTVGERVAWRVRSTGTQEIRLAVFFRRHSPFGQFDPTTGTYLAQRSFATWVSRSGETLGVGEARVPGEFKYDVQVVDRAGNVEDEDPFIVVR